MFKIRYKIIEYADNVSNEVTTIQGEYGQLELSVNDKKYGVYTDDDNTFFNVVLSTWFYLLLEAIYVLEDKTYVLIHDIETQYCWLEIKRSYDFLNISEVPLKGSIEGTLGIETQTTLDVEYNSWKDEKVLYDDFKNEVLNKSEQYIAEMCQLNGTNHSGVHYITNQLKKVKTYLSE